MDGYSIVLSEAVAREWKHSYEELCLARQTDQISPVQQMKVLK